MKLKQIIGAEVYYDEDNKNLPNTFAMCICTSEKGVIRPDKFTSYDIDLMIEALQKMKKKGASSVILSFVGLNPSKTNPNTEKSGLMMMMTQCKKPETACIIAPRVDYDAEILGISIPVDRRRIAAVKRCLENNNLREVELAIAQCLKKTKKVE
jgi:hypothetical protein